MFAASAHLPAGHYPHRIEKLTTTAVRSRLTYEIAISYARWYLKDQIVAVTNADVYFDDSLLLLGEGMSGRALLSQPNTVRNVGGSSVLFCLFLNGTRFRWGPL